MIQFQKDFDKLEVSRISVDYDQEGDCCEDRDSNQTLRLETADGGGGPFIRMSIIEGEHFSVNSLYDLYLIFKDFMDKVNYPDLDWLELDKIMKDAYCSNK